MYTAIKVLWEAVGGNLNQLLVLVPVCSVKAVPGKVCFQGGIYTVQMSVCQR